MEQVKIISHRGNSNGPDTTTENTVNAIMSMIDIGFDVEIDVWRIDGVLYLCHDFDKTRTFGGMEDFLMSNSKNLWIHCKNMEALEYLLKFKTLNVFGHSNDEFVLTSLHYIFCKPGSQPLENSIVVMPEMTPIYTRQSLKKCYGILTDYPLEIKHDNLDRFII